MSFCHATCEPSVGIQTLTQWNVLLVTEFRCLFKHLYAKLKTFFMIDSKIVVFCLNQLGEYLMKTHGDGSS